MKTEEKLQALRNEWRTASKERRLEIEDQAAKLKSWNCYICQKPIAEENPHFPFCSAPCHEVYKRDNPKPKIEGKPQSMEELKKRIEMRRQEVIKDKHRPKQEPML